MIGAALLAAAAIGLPCAPAEGVVRCDGLVPTWDGVPLDTTVVLPSEGTRDAPLIVSVHGLGNSKHEYLDPASEAYTGNAYGWARRGYAVLTYTARGFWASCGTPEARLAEPVACARGWLHLADVRYEVRDAQELIGRLVDAGIADPRRIGVTGDSYGGGQTTMLAALRDRVMERDGRLVPWRSPQGTPLRVAAAAPVIPWTNLVGAIAPNGLTRSGAVTPYGTESAPVGVFKATFANAVFAATQVATGPGQPSGEPFVPGRPEAYQAPPGLDPDADVAGWVLRADLGEPYTDARAKAIVADLDRFHSAYGIDASSPPPPLFFGTGFTDDLFPVNEVLRYVHRTRRDHPGVPISVLMGDFGHQRAANKPADRDRLLDDIRAFFAHHLRGARPAPRRGFTALTQTCPRGRSSEGPFRARTFARLARGRVRFSEAGARTIDARAGDPQLGIAVDPVTGGGDGCRETPAADQDGTATYRLPAARGTGFTLLGAPVVRARLRVSGAPPEDAQVAARLWDVAPDGATQRLVARGAFRPVGERFELHPAAWRFEEGHVAKLELLGNDLPFLRPSNGAFTVEVSDLRLTLPVREPRRCARGRCAPGP